MEGYPTAIFESGFDNKFICGLCKKILRDPLQSFCGHRFCKECVKKTIGSSSNVPCPSCTEEHIEDGEYNMLKSEQMFPDNAVKREMIRQSAMCANSGCTWRGVFKDYTAHEQACDYRTFPCTQCGQSISGPRMNDHLSKDCPQRPIQCKYCNATIVQADMEEHNQICQKYPTKCDNCGKKKIPREQLQDHLQRDCSKRTVQCPLGCPDQMSWPRFHAHLSKNVGSHLAWVMDKLFQLEQQINEGVSGNHSQGSLNEITTAITRLEHKVSTFEAQLQSVNNFTAFQKRLEVTEAKVTSFEPIMGVLHKEIEKCVHVVEDVERSVGSTSQQRLDQICQQTEEFQAKIQNLERNLAIKEIALAEHELRMQGLEFASYDGSLLWRIGDIKKKRQDALMGNVTSLYSPAFFTGRLGYKMCARVYLNGDGIGKGTHISLFFVVMRGHYDALLPWPFRQKVTLMIVDQNFREHVIDTFQPDTGSSSFRRPISEMNIASGCPLFLPLSRLDDPAFGFVKDDVIFIKIIVETDGLAKYTELNPLRSSVPVVPPGLKK
ncbi:TNF receptor-associated factor 2-like [Gigantopelta aegis]|uniref:TNF receptor-associated factor 2-like n=1 Tax=Gigantopelta aegis TaxID=1735272 RepID=UPI001B88BB80|nr:TNF receptor-associated factor 2-like [Gigantopelta aegis]